MKMDCDDNVKEKLFREKGNEPLLNILTVDFYPKNVILCICWDWKAIVYYELLLKNQALNSDWYLLCRP